MVTLTEVAKVTGLQSQTVRRRADTVWSQYCIRDERNRRVFTRMPPTTLRANPADADTKRHPVERRRAQGPRFEGSLPQIDAPDVSGLLGLRKKGHSGDPVSMMDWALHWQERGLVLFPCSKFLGDPLLQNWYAPANKFGNGGATNGRASVIMWWSQWPYADIAAVPHKSEHFVIIAVKEEGGYDSLGKIRGDLPDLDFKHWAPWGEHHLWFKSSSLVQTSHHRLGRGLHVMGPGTYVFLPRSSSPFIAQKEAA
jgi:hypothetical protein